MPERDLLDVLNDVICTHPAEHSTLRGQIGIGIRTIGPPPPQWHIDDLQYDMRLPESDRWLCVTFDGAVRATEFLSFPPGTADALLLMGEPEAAWIRRVGMLPPDPGLLIYEGDRELIAKFLEEYSSLVAAENRAE